MKKRERTVNLVNESEVLENQNIDLKAQLKVTIREFYLSQADVRLSHLLQIS